MTTTNHHCEQLLTGWMGGARTDDSKTQWWPPPSTTAPPTAAASNCSWDGNGEHEVWDDGKREEVQQWRQDDGYNQHLSTLLRATACGGGNRARRWQEWEQDRWGDNDNDNDGNRNDGSHIDPSPGGIFFFFSFSFFFWFQLILLLAPLAFVWGVFLNVFICVVPSLFLSLSLSTQNHVIFKKIKTYINLLAM